MRQVKKSNKESRGVSTLKLTRDSTIKIQKYGHRTLAPLLIAAILLAYAPSPARAQEQTIPDRMLHHRAVMWAMPLMNFKAFRDALIEVGVGPNDIGYFSKIQDWNFQTPGLSVQDISEEIDEGYKGYPSKGRRIGTPTDVEWDLDHSFPKPDSLLELILRSRQVSPHEKP